MSNSDIGEIERLSIVQACTNLIYRFAERTDACDADALADMFVEDGVFARPSMPDKPIRGRETIRAQFRARPPGKLTRHLCINPAVTVVSAREARAHSYILLYTGTLAEDAVLPVAADAKQLLGAFADSFMCDSDGVWKFRERQGSLALTIGG